MDLQQRPSIFELISCSRLRSSLREALRYLLKHLSPNFINEISIIGVDEIVLTLDILIEYNFLRSYSASYAENLYNLIRVQHDGAQNLKGIKSILPSLISLTLVPYLGHKLDLYIEGLNYKEQRTADDLRKIKIYKLMKKFSTIADVIFIMRYTTNKTIYHEAIARLLNISLETRSINDNDDETATLSKGVADMMGRILTVGSYIIQFLDYWNTHTNSAPLFSSSGPIPKAPSRENYLHSDERSANICLICLHMRKNECVLSNTGYVFCYNCIHRYVTSKQKCPVTGHPSNVDNIVKLFTSAPS